MHRTKVKNRHTKKLRTTLLFEKKIKKFCPQIGKTGSFQQSTKLLKITQTGQFSNVSRDFKTGLTTVCEIHII